MVSSPADRPTATELIEAVREYLERDVMPLEGRTGFHARVARNALGMIQRELDLGPGLEAECRDRLAELLGDSRKDLSLRELEGELVTAIRAGDFDERLSEVAECVRKAVDAKLAISNPEYFVE
ncbi:MAG: hypothetical protein DCC49_08235 [Acidobacteria bacterium]|nr:MAG: hypothetical protein DCC49_08235 [Acidobacteriota bacterium]